MKTQAVIRFRDFELNSESYELRRAGQVQKLERIPMELLLMLASRPGLLVTRSEIAQHLWESDVFVDVERGINTAIAKIRRVLTEDAGQPQCIQTVVGKGYRFVADVLPEPECEPENVCDPQRLIPLAPSSEVAPVSQPPPTVVTPQHNRRKAYVIAAIGLILAGIVFATTQLRHFLTPGSAAQIRSIAVLPMANLASDPSQEYFVEGMTDQLITNLAQATSLRVISRTSVMRFKNARVRLPEIARILDVDAVVEGSVMRMGGQLTIQAQLLDARRDKHLWAQTYTGSDDRALMLQNEVTQDIAQHVAATLRPGSAAAVTRSAENIDAKAYEDYLRARFYLAKRTPEALDKAAQSFQKVIEQSPAYAQAYVGLADVYNVISFYTGRPPSECFPRAEAAARKAMSLEPSLGEAHAALGETLFSYYWDWQGAEREFREAIHLSPAYAPAHHWYSQLLSMLRRHSEALSEIEAAHELDPLSLVINSTMTGTLYLARRYDDAVVQARKTLDLDPNYGPAHQLLAWTYMYLNRGTDAIEEERILTAASGDSSSTQIVLGCAYAVAGKTNEAKEIAATLEKRAKEEYVSPESMARLYLFLDEKDLALDKLEAAYTMHVDTLNNMYVEPVYDRLRSDQRFQALLRKMRFIP